MKLKTIAVMEDPTSFKAALVPEIPDLLAASETDGQALDRLSKDDRLHRDGACAFPSRVE
jgi:hypothetical protein